VLEPETQTTPKQAAALLVAASAIEVEADRGETLEIWTMSPCGFALGRRPKGLTLGLAWAANESGKSGNRC
jgi:hypothetical protein